MPGLFLCLSITNWRDTTQKNFIINTKNTKKNNFDILRDEINKIIN